jgi:Xaa-Pro aminopeptidase
VDDKIKTWGMLQFGHGLGIVFYEPPTISRGISFEYPTVLKENMVLAFETYAGRPFGNEGVRLEENILVTKDGFEFLSLHPLEPKMTDKVQPKTAKGL